MKITVTIDDTNHADILAALEARNTEIVATIDGDR
jgi:hypothetical protein